MKYYLQFFQKLERSHIKGYKEEIAHLKSEALNIKELEGQLKSTNNRVVELEEQVARLSDALEVIHYFLHFD